MFWYIMICALMLYPLSIVYVGRISEKKTQCVALLMACIILWFFMAMRHVSVGVDTKYYMHVFSQFQDIPLYKVFTAETFATDSETWSLDFEYGYRLYNKIISIFCRWPQIITICNSTLIIVLLYYSVKKQSPNYLLSIWLYITLGIFQTEMNVTRNAIAILIVYNASCFLEKKQLPQYIFSCVLAMMFHKAAVILIPVYWLVHNIRWNQKRLAILIACAVAFGVLFPVIRPILSAVLPQGITRYFYSKSSKLEAAVVGVFYLLLFLVAYILAGKEKRNRVFSQFAVGSVMLALNLSCFGLSFGLGYAARLAALFGPYLIYYIPQVLSLIENPSNRRMSAALIVMISGVQYVMRLCINNIGGTMPYMFFW